MYFTLKNYSYIRLISPIMYITLDSEVACSASDRKGSNFEYCVCRAVSSHYPPEVLLAQFSLHLHMGGLKPYMTLIPVLATLFIGFELCFHKT